MCASAPPPYTPCRLRRYRRLQEQLLLLSGGQIWATGVLWRLSTHISLSQTNTFPRTVKFSRRRRHQGAPATRNPAPLFSQISSKSFQRSFVALFFFNLSFHFSIYSCFPWFLSSRLREVLRVCAFNVIHSQVDVLFFLFLIDTMPTTVA